jgi:hypothetical protein
VSVKSCILASPPPNFAGGGVFSAVSAEHEVANTEEAERLRTVIYDALDAYADYDPVLLL